MPASFRHALEVSCGNLTLHIICEIYGSVMTRSCGLEDILVIGFLAFLEQDMIENPENIIPLTTEAFAEAQRLTAGITVDLNEVLPENNDNE